MTDIVERLRVYATDDHERGCQGMTSKEALGKEARAALEGK